MNDSLVRAISKQSLLDALATAERGQRTMARIFALEELADHFAAEDSLAAAVALYEQALVVARQSQSVDALALALNNLGYHYLISGKPLQAKPLLLEALAIAPIDSVGEDDTRATLMLNLAQAYWRLGDPDSAIVLARGSLAQRQRMFGWENQHTLQSANAVGLLLKDQGFLEDAARLFERSLVARERLFGPRSVEVATALDNFGGLRNKQGRYAEARALSERALSIYEERLGPNARDVSVCLANVADDLVNLGLYAAAVPLLERAFHIAERVYGPDGQEVGFRLFVLGQAFYKLHRYGEAEAALARSQLITARTLGPNHWRVALTIGERARVRFSLGELDSALAYFSASELGFASALGTRHPFTAGTLVDMGEVLRRMGRMDEAQACLNQSVATLRDTGIVAPRSLILALRVRAELAFQQGEFDSVLDYALESQTRQRALFVENARTLPEAEAVAFASRQETSLGLAVTALASRVPRDSDDRTRRVLDEIVRSRALIVDGLTLRLEMARADTNAAIADALRKVEAAGRQLSGLVIGGGGAGNPERFRQTVAAAQARLDRVQRELAEVAGGLLDEQDRGEVGLNMIASRLPPKTTLLSVVLYPRPSKEDSPSARRTAGAKRSPNFVPWYAAFVLRAGEADPRLVDLGRASRIDSLVDRWRGLARIEVEYAPLGLDRISRQLRELIWDPVAPYLAGARDVFVVPDGHFNFVNLAALPTKPGHYLVETGPLIHYLSAERDLSPQSYPAESSQGLLAIGGVDYDHCASDSLYFAVSAPDGDTISIAQGYRSARSGCAYFAQEIFQPLPQSEIEVQEIAALWQSFPHGVRGMTNVLSGSSATEGAFKRLAPGHRVIHVATHGFFIDERCPSFEAAVSDASEPSPPYGVAENPLLRSGLVFAGANRHGDVGPGEEDGILTAEEIAALDLRGVDLVVLSACETGSGTLMDGEGVFGLRRALRMSGARDILMSLWQVNDAFARRWMRAFYSAAATRHGSAACARDATLQLMQERRQRGETSVVSQWGTFVVTEGPHPPH